MKRRSKIITFVIAAVLSYGILFAFVGPEKVRAWHCTPSDSSSNWETEKEAL